MKKWTLLKLSLFIGALALLTTFSLTRAQSQPVFRIGVLDNDRGAISNGARLAVEQINAAGGVRGADGTMFRLELIVQPTNGGANLATAVNNINQASVIAVLGPTTTEEVLGGLSVLQSMNVPILTPAIGDTIIASDSTGLIYRTRAAERLQGRALANYLVNDLQIRDIITVQLDTASTAAVIGFSTEAAALGAAPRTSILLESGMQISQLVSAVSGANPQIAAVYGPPDVASSFLNALRGAGWGGLVYYNHADEPAFRAAITPGQTSTILGTTTWAFTNTDPVSMAFISSYIQMFGSLPGAIDAAGYDSISLLAEAIKQPGDLKTNLANLNVQGVQGILQPAQVGRGESSNNVEVFQLNEFGSLDVRARFQGTQRIPIESAGGGVIPTIAPNATPTLQGVYITIKSSVQNVRTGPSQQYDVLGQLKKGDTAQVIGASLDFSWVVIDFRGQQGWLATSLLDVTGDRSTVPVIAAPPTPTPAPATATPTPAPTPDIVIAAASPNAITLGVPFTVSVTVVNQGGGDAGAFAVAATFNPDGVYSAVNVPGLPAGQQIIVNLTGTLTSTTGFYSVVIVADLNNQVNEGAGEANNGSFVFSYKVDRPVLNSATVTLNPGNALTLEGSGPIDVQWNATGTSLDFPSPPAGSGMYVIVGVSSLNDIHYALINPALATLTNLNVALLPNAFIGIITAEGHRGVMHVDNVISGGPITLSYRVYQP